MRYRRTLTLTVGGVLLLAVAGAATALAQDKDGGGSAPITLSLAVADPAGRQSEAAVDDLVDVARELSDGMVVIEPVFDAGAGTEQGFEHGVAEMVKSGSVDLAMIGARAWDLVGVTSLQAFNVPLLIDDADLALKVAQSDIADRALASMGHGVTGLAMWPEHMRYLVSFPPSGRVFRSPSDVGDATILVVGSTPVSSFVTTLGGRTYTEGMRTDVFTGDRGTDSDSGALSGMEIGLTGAAPPRSDAIAVGDVVLVPKYQTLAINTEGLESLTADQRAVLADAVAVMERAAFERQPAETELGAAWCSNGGSVVLAGADQLAAFRRRAEPVRTALVSDPLTAELVADIEALKATVDPAPPLAECGREASTVFPVSDTTGFVGTLPPQGSYRANLTVEGLMAGGSSRRFAEANAGMTTWTFTADKASLHATNIDGDHRCSAPMTSVDGEIVRLGASSGDCGITFDFVWRAEPDGVSLRLLAPPPEAAWTLQDFTDFRPAVEVVWTRVD